MLPVEKSDRLAGPDMVDDADDLRRTSSPAGFSCRGVSGPGELLVPTEPSSD